MNVRIGIKTVDLNVGGGSSGILFLMLDKM
jgi:hypothetical protein